MTAQKKNKALVTAAEVVSAGISNMSPTGTLNVAPMLSTRQAKKITAALIVGASSGHVGRVVFILSYDTARLCHVPCSPPE
jgi:hypothetical protein